MAITGLIPSLEIVVNVQVWAKEIKGRKVRRSSKAEAKAEVRVENENEVDRFKEF